MRAIDEMVKALEVQVKEAKDSMNDAKQYGVNSPGFNAYMGQMEMAETMLEEARRLAAEEKAQRASAPASLVDKIYDLAQSRNGDGCDPIWPSELLEVISCYRPAPDRTGELVKRLKEWWARTQHIEDEMEMGTIRQFNKILRDFEGGA